MAEVVAADESDPTRIAIPIPDLHNDADVFRPAFSRADPVEM